MQIFIGILEALVSMCAKILSWQSFVGVAAYLLSFWAMPAVAQQNTTLGFVVRDWFTAIYESRFMDECPQGLSIANDELWWRSLSKSDRAKFTDNGLVQVLDRFNQSIQRGPGGENVCLDPQSVTDPPLRIVEGKFSYGVNLDGTTDGHATTKSCAHGKFIGVDGTPGVDNQMYRLLGCTYGWRHVGTVEDNANEQRGTNGQGMILIEIKGVSNRRNSPAVTVTFYRSVDQFAQDPHGAPLPFSSYRIDAENGKPRYGDSVKGSIKDGILTTETADIRLPFYGNGHPMSPVIRDMSMRLELSADGKTAKGVVTGYYDLDQFLYYLVGMGGVIPVNGIDCPSIYRAAHRLADGYPDPKTGECTMLSTAFKINAYAAFIVGPGEGEGNTSTRP